MKIILISIIFLLSISPVDAALEEGATYIEKISNPRELALSIFEGKEPLIIFTNELVRIEVLKADVVSELEWLQEYHKRDKQLLELIKKSKGDIQANSLEGKNAERMGYRISDLLQKGKAQVYDLSKKEYVKTITIAEWSRYGGGDIYFLKGSKLEFGNEIFITLTSI